MKKAVSMPCTEAQFEAMRPKLETIIGLRITVISDWEDFPYLVNNFRGRENVITNINMKNSGYFNRTVYPEFNEQIFLEACGYQTAEAKLDAEISRRLNELSERIARLEVVMTGQVEDAKPEIDYSRIKTGSKVKLKGYGDRIFGVVFWDSPYYISRNRTFLPCQDGISCFTFYRENEYFLNLKRRKNEKPDFVTEVVEY